MLDASNYPVGTRVIVNCELFAIVNAPGVIVSNTSEIIPGLNYEVALEGEVGYARPHAKMELSLIEELDC